LLYKIFIYVEHEGGSAYSGRVRKVLDLTDDDDVAEYASNTIKKLKRTDSTTFGVERNIDKRWGKQPVQARIVLRQAGTIPKTQVDDDDDIDDKAKKLNID